MSGIRAPGGLARAVVAASALASGCATADIGTDAGIGPAVDAREAADASEPRPDGAPIPVDAAPVDAAPVDAAPPVPDAAPPPDAAPAACVADTTLACGEIAQHSLLLSDADIDGYGCQTVPTTGSENIYTFTAATDGTAVLALDVLEDDPLIGDDFDLYVLSPSCDTSSCVAQAATAGDDVLEFDVTGGETYFVVVEAFAAGLLTFMNYDLQLTCL